MGTSLVFLQHEWWLGIKNPSRYITEMYLLNVPFGMQQASISELDQKSNLPSSQNAKEIRARYKKTTNYYDDTTLTRVAMNGAWPQNLKPWTWPSYDGRVLFLLTRSEWKVFLRYITLFKRIFEILLNRSFEFFYQS